MPFRCSYCLTTVKSQRGLRQHIDGKPECRAKEKERAGLVDMSTLLSLKSPPVASIPKRTYDDFMSPSVSPSLDFDVSELDALLGLTKPKRARRLFGRVEGREPGLSKEAIEALAMKKLTCIAGTKIEAVMDHLGLRDSSTTNVPKKRMEMMCIRPFQALPGDHYLITGTC